MAAEEIERIVAEQIRAVGHDTEVFDATLAAARARANGSRVDAEDLRRALGLWDDVWGALTPRGQARAMALLVEDVAYDGKTGSAALTFRPSGIQALAKEFTRRRSSSRAHEAGPPAAERRGARRRRAGHG